MSPDLSAPVPLGYRKAVERALELRARGSEWTWGVIADVMAEYHGFKRGSDWWRLQCLARGAVRRPRGAAFQKASVA